MKVVWSDESLDDIQAVHDYIHEANPVAAARVADALFTAGRSLSYLPRRGRPGPAPGTRELVIVRPYIIVYEVGDDRVTILRIWHGAQQR